jgi:GNAT superfamily N-acetyltransferase
MPAVSSIREISARVEGIEAEAFAQLLLALGPAVRAQLRMQVYRHGTAVSLLAAGADEATVNCTIGLGFEHELDDDRLAAICTAYVSAGIPRWLVSWSPEASPREAGELFARHGGRARTPTAKLWRSLDHELRSVSHSALPKGHPRVDEIGSESAAAFQTTVAQSLGFPAILEPLTASTVGHEHWHHYLAFDGQDAVAGAAMFVLGEGAWLGLSATLPHARGRGAHKMLIARRLYDAMKLGCTWVTAETFPDMPDQPNRSYQNMCRAGMRLLYHRPKYLFGTVSGN